MKNTFLNYINQLTIYHYVIFLFIIIITTVMLRNCLAKQDLKRDKMIVNVKIIDDMLPGKSMTYALYKCEFHYRGKSKILISQFCFLF